MQAQIGEACNVAKSTPPILVTTTTPLSTVRVDFRRTLQIACSEADLAAESSHEAASLRCRGGTAKRFPLDFPTSIITRIHIGCSIVCHLGFDV